MLSCSCTNKKDVADKLQVDVDEAAESHLQ